MSWLNFLTCPARAVLKFVLRLDYMLSARIVKDKSKPELWNPQSTAWSSTFDCGLWALSFVILNAVVVAFGRVMSGFVGRAEGDANVARGADELAVERHGLQVGDGLRKGNGDDVCGV
ncbi:MAG: hypothetical protein QOF02_2728 [Blastocatellia bacterium]|nr:hypothetical protein [Blastocatellia bacterium]